jgi:hypothetical protein
MPLLNLRFLDARRTPLDDQVDVEITRLRTNEQVVRIRNHDGRKKLAVRDLLPGDTYVVRAFPMRHRPVSQFAVIASGNKATDMELYTPLHPQRVAEVEFPEYMSLDPALRAVLEKSTLERDAVPPPRARGSDMSPGQIVYETLTRIERAGLLNLFCKLNNTPLGDVTTWAYLTDIYRIRGDRLFANVQIEFRDRVKNAVVGGGFKEVDGALHTPPPGFSSAGSFKSLDLYGNLQLSFFASADQPLRFRVDADVDDAAGIGHAFQVLDHWLTGDETHPFDISQILTFHQRLDVGYRLLA